MEQASSIKLGIGLPIVNRSVDRDFVLSFVTMQKPDCTVYAPTQEVYGFPNDIADVRNGLVYQSLADNCSHLLMMDTDQIYPNDAVLKLMEHDVDAVGALVHRRYPPFAPILYRGDLGKYNYVPYDETYSDQLVEVDATGCGCILYNMNVFKKIPPPWFELIPHENGKPVGEDIRFCSKMREVGFRVFVDTSVHIDHITTFRVNRGTYDLFRKIYLPKGERP
jgi:hypothetical protein